MVTVVRHGYQCTNAFTVVTSGYSGYKLHMVTVVTSGYSWLQWLPVEGGKEGGGRNTVTHSDLITTLGSQWVTTEIIERGG